jgi:hypothetical protein
VPAADRAWLGRRRPQCRGPVHPTQAARRSDERPFAPCAASRYAEVMVSVAPGTI